MILCHARRDPDLQGVVLERVGPRRFVVGCRPDWSALFPQSAHLLREEAVAWQKTAWRIEFAGR